MVGEMKTARGAKRAQIEDARRVAKAGMPAKLGVRILSVTAKKVTAELPIKKFHLNRNGRVNGGAIMAFADPRRN